VKKWEISQQKDTNSAMLSEKNWEKRRIFGQKYEIWLNLHAQVPFLWQRQMS